VAAEVRLRPTANAWRGDWQRYWRRMSPGYSRLMGVDEDGTLARLKAVRKALIDPTGAGRAKADGIQARQPEARG
jgi:hypothetical protein